MRAAPGWSLAALALAAGAWRPAWAALEVHCHPYGGCKDQWTDVPVSGCPECALSENATCENRSETSCSGETLCHVYRPPDDCVSESCFIRCVSDNVDYIFMYAPYYSTSTTTTSTSTTITVTTVTVTTRTETTTTSTSTSSTSLTSTATVTGTSTSTSTATVTTTTWNDTDPTTLDGGELRSAAREVEDNLVRYLAEQGGGSAVRRTALVTVVAQHVRPEDVAPGGAVALEVPGAGAGVSVPEAVLRAAGEPVVLSVAAFNQSSVASFEATETGAQLAAAPVSVRVRRASSLEDANFSGSLPESILLELLPAQAAGARCAYWDEAQARWSSQGLAPVPSADGKFVCATTHLTIFAAIIGEFEKVFECSNAHVFSSEGLDAIGRGDWAHRAPAVLLWIVLALHSLLLVWAVFYDWRAYRGHAWRDTDFLTTNEAFREPISCKAWIMEPFTRYLPGSGPEASKDEEAAAGAKPRRKGRCCLCFPRALVDSVSVTITADCATYEVARREHISPEDLRDLVLGTLVREEVCECGTTFSAKARFCMVCGKPRPALGVLGLPSPMAGAGGTGSFVTTALRKAVAGSVKTMASTVRKKVPDIVDVIHNSGFCARTWGLFLAMHPWAQLLSLGIYYGAFIRALLLTAKLLGALMLSGLFFEASGKATKLGSPDHCDMDDFWLKLCRDLMFGFFSILLSTVPLFLIQNCTSRRFIFGESWDKKSKRTYVMLWRLQDFIIIFLTGGYCVFCLVFTMAFLANINKSAEAEWLLSALYALFQEFVTTPLSLAMLYAAVAMLVVRWRPELDAQVQARLGIELGIAGEEAEAVAASMPTAEAPEPEGPTAALEELALDAPPPPRATSALDVPVAPMLLPGMPQAQYKNNSVSRAEPCAKCGSRLWAATGSEICPMCGHLLPIKRR